MSTRRLVAASRPPSWQKDQDQVEEEQRGADVMPRSLRAAPPPHVPHPHRHDARLRRGKRAAYHSCRERAACRVIRCMQGQAVRRILTDTNLLSPDMEPATSTASASTYAALVCGNGMHAASTLVLWGRAPLRHRRGSRRRFIRRGEPIIWGTTSSRPRAAPPSPSPDWLSVHACGRARHVQRRRCVDPCTCAALRYKRADLIAVYDSSMTCIWLAATSVSVYQW